MLRWLYFRESAVLQYWTCAAWITTRHSLIQRSRLRCNLPCVEATPILCTRIHDRVPLPPRKCIFVSPYLQNSWVISLEMWKIHGCGPLFDLATNQENMNKAKKSLVVPTSARPNSCPPNFGLWASLNRKHNTALLEISNFIKGATGDQQLILPLASCPLGPATAHGVGILTEMDVISISVYRFKGTTGTGIKNLLLFNKGVELLFRPPVVPLMQSDLPNLPLVNPAFY